VAGDAPDGALRILLVDDEEDIRVSLRRLLARLPVEAVHVDEAANGEDAIRTIRSGAYHLILSDYRLGRVSGVDVLEIARIERPETVRVLMTAYEEMEIAQQAVNRARIEGFIRKPWENDALLALVGRLLLERFPAPAA
jgi:YesN/AraC family two-component response regulator